MTPKCSAIGYQMLSRLFRYPDDPAGLTEAVAWFSESGCWQYRPARKGVSFRSEPEERENDSAVLPEINPEALGELQNDYIRLFVNALPEVPCPPYGSYYLEGTLKGKTTVELERLYDAYGFRTGELADHVGVVLEFLAILTLLGDREPVREDFDFAAKQLHVWLPEFFDRVIESGISEFYAGAANTGRRYLLDSQAKKT